VVDAARPCRHAVGGRWFADETYVKVRGAWCYAYRAVDQHGQVIDVCASARSDVVAARTFFTAALIAPGEPEEVVTDLACALEHVIEEVVPAAFHNTSQYASNGVECDHARLKARLQPTRGLKTDPTSNVIISGHEFMQNLRRGRYNSALMIETVISGSRPRSTNAPSNLTGPENTPIPRCPEDHQGNSAVQSHRVASTCSVIAVGPRRVVLWAWANGALYER
jgi:transposase, IS6 family